MVEKSKEYGVVAYVGYDKKKDVYYMEYYREGEFAEREIISKEVAKNRRIGTLLTMGEDEFGNYSGYFDTHFLNNKFEKIIKNL